MVSVIGIISVVLIIPIGGCDGMIGKRTDKSRVFFGYVGKIV
jgi:hypothetical protein